MTGYSSTLGENWRWTLVCTLDCYWWNRVLGCLQHDIQADRRRHAVLYVQMKVLKLNVWEIQSRWSIIARIATACLLPGRTSFGCSAGLLRIVDIRGIMPGER